MTVHIIHAILPVLAAPLTKVLDDKVIAPITVNQTLQRVLELNTIGGKWARQALQALFGEAEFRKDRCPMSCGCSSCADQSEWPHHQSLVNELFETILEFPERSGESHTECCMKQPSHLIWKCASLYVGDSVFPMKKAYEFQQFLVRLIVPLDRVVTFCVRSMRITNDQASMSSKFNSELVWNTSFSQQPILQSLRIVALDTPHRGGRLNKHADVFAVNLP